MSFVATPTRLAWVIRYDNAGYHCARRHGGRDSPTPRFNEETGGYPSGPLATHDGALALSLGLVLLVGLVLLLSLFGLFLGLFHLLLSVLYFLLSLLQLLLGFL